MKRFAVLFAMPTSRRAFFAAADTVPMSDYMRITLAGDSALDVWSRRYGRIADAAQSLIKRLADRRIPTVEQATLDDLRNGTSNADVVVLFAHWCSVHLEVGRRVGHLELADGMHSVEAIEGAIGSDFAGTLDLCNCTSESLAGHIKRCRGDAISTLFNTEVLDPLPAYVIVGRVIEYCLETGVDYGLARLETARELRRSM